MLFTATVLVGVLFFVRPFARHAESSPPTSAAVAVATPKPKRDIAAERAFFHLRNASEVVLWDQRVAGTVGPDRHAIIAAPIASGGSIGSTNVAIFDADSFHPIGNLNMNGSVQRLAINDGRLDVWVSDYQPQDEYHRPSFLKKTTFAMHAQTLDAVAFGREPNPQLPVETPAAVVIQPKRRPRIIWDSPPPTVGKDFVPVRGVAPGSTCDDESIETVSDDGEVIATIEGHRYEVEAGDQPTASVWTEASDLLICETSSGLKIINKDDNESVLATRL